MLINKAFKMENEHYETDHIDPVCEAEHWNGGVGNAEGLNS